MEAKRIVAVIGAIDVVLLVICLVLYLGKDRKAPEIFFSEENQVTYQEGMDEELLLQGVTAMDEKDGDVSESLLVEKVTGINGKEVIVTYVARDGADNVGKASRAFRIADEDEEKEILSAEKEKSGTEGSNKIENAAGDESESEREEETQTMPENSPVSYESEQEKNDKEEPAGKNPVLILNADVITTKKGTAPNWHEVIETMSDDEDDYNTLYNNLKLEGQVKLNEAGEYPVTLYTVDEDGNRSEVRSLVVKVE